MQLIHIKPEEIRVNEAFNSRIDYGDTRELADSIRETGIQQPITVIRDKDGYSLIDGFRRMRAISLLQDESQAPESIPALLRELSETESLYIQSVGNSGKQLSPLEFGELCRRLENKGESISDIARKTGKSPGYISDCIGLSYAPEAIQEAVRTGTISGTAAIRAMKTDGIDTLEAEIAEIQETGKAPKPKATPKPNPEKILTELYQVTGNEKIAILIELISGNIGIQAISHEFKTHF